MMSLTSVDHQHLFIGGNWVKADNDQMWPVINPATEATVCSVALGSAADIHRAVSAAGDALAEWSATPLSERLAILQSMGDSLAARASEIAEIVSVEVGTPQAYCEASQVGSAVEVFGATVSTAGSFAFEQRNDELLTIMEPVGVVGVITPWNFPLTLAVMKIAPALAAGCSVVFKAPEQAPLTSYILAESAREAGLPPGVLNVVPGLGSTAGEALVAHEKVAMVSFTGSTSVGKRVAALASNNVTRVNLELGGKSACIILEDADLKAAVNTAMGVVMFNAGQNCGAWSRLLVPEHLAETVGEEACQLALSARLGDPFDPKTTVGPVVSKRQYDRVRSYIEIGEREGAVVAQGGGSRPVGLDSGFFVAPTVLTKVNNDMRVAQEEIFGPVVCIIPYEGEDDAVRLANDSVYGLHGGVFSRDRGHAEAVGRRIRTGQVCVNGLHTSPSAPFGGFKESGIGRTGGPLGLQGYLEPKAILF